MIERTLQAPLLALFRLPPLHLNVRKRLVKTPKLYFYDSGLLCYLIGIRAPDQLDVHPMRGAVLENWVVAEVVKYHLHRAATPTLHFYRDRQGLEVDLVVDRGSDLVATEVKSGRTAAPDVFSAHERFGAVSGRGRKQQDVVIYGGEASQKRTRGDLISWQDITAFEWLK